MRLRGCCGSWVLGACCGNSSSTCATLCSGFRVYTEAIHFASVPLLMPTRLPARSHAGRREVQQLLRQRAGVQDPGAHLPRGRALLQDAAGSPALVLGSPTVLVLLA